MPASHRLAVTLKQRTEASAVLFDAAETPRAVLDAWVSYLRSLERLAEMVDPEAAAAVTKRVAEGVSVGAAEMRALIEQAIGGPHEPVPAQGPPPLAG